MLGTILVFRAVFLGKLVVYRHKGESLLVVGDQLRDDARAGLRPARDHHDAGAPQTLAGSDPE